jgi:tRNA(Ile)-lysidine synthase
LLALVGEGDCLLSGHHENDQAETLLLNLLRGSGPAGLAGIGASQSFGAGRLLRPMLGVAGGDIRDYADRRQLTWIDDPSNVDTRFDRNFLRREVMPLLRSRWPAAAASLRRSAGLISESSDLLEQLADMDLEHCGQPSRLAVAPLHALAPARQRNVLRRAIRLAGLPPLPATRLYQAIDELVPARADAQPRVTWPGGELRRFDGFVFVLPEMAAEPSPDERMLLPDSAPVALGDRLGRIGLSLGTGRGLDPDTVRRGLRIAFRRGGETLRIRDGGPTRKLKKLLQEAGILPWMRDRLPLLYADDRLVAVADLWISADASSEPGYRIEWTGKPVIRAAID